MRPLHAVAVHAAKVAEIRNAVIDATILGIEDHGILTAFIYLDYDGVHQGFGGYAFDYYDRGCEQRKGSAYGTEFIRRTLDVLGVEEWEKLAGTPCRVRSTHSRVEAIGHFVKDQWFEPERDLAFLRSER